VIRSGSAHLIRERMQRFGMTSVTIVEGESPGAAFRAQLLADPTSRTLQLVTDASIAPALQHPTVVQVDARDPATGDMMSVTGRLEVSPDSGQWRERWYRQIAALFRDGGAQSRISWLRFAPVRAYFWDSVIGPPGIVDSDVDAPLEQGEGRVHHSYVVECQADQANTGASPEETPARAFVRGGESQP
jgi:Pyridoxamine 5'-phosphate oxidase like